MNYGKVFLRYKPVHLKSMPKAEMYFSNTATTYAYFRYKSISIRATTILCKPAHLLAKRVIPFTFESIASHRIAFSDST